ncbi:hypothetical protein G7Y41_07155 [Schaalia sp. ZJ405]|uniref:hypothetical protein n=1 Tax=Schaalia sp. ZJ405 TaxID=2709403 RepID=UPI0013EAFA9F|nr:hypothetical protein [Schaalia sp. ZJ405]QPK80831.1 hypothetical protein G7Y41_07155 [Schaalia sp. ZJ405]
MKIDTTWFIIASAGATVFTASRGHHTATVVCALLTLTALGLTAAARIIENRKLS